MSGFRVERITLNRSGRWIMVTDRGECCELVLAGGWISGGGLVMALAWRIPAGHRRMRRTLRVWLFARDHGATAWRRLIVRLRMRV